MRLNLVNADVTVDNGNSDGCITADDNSNTTLSTNQNSAVIQNGKWAWKQGVGREDEHGNTLTYDSNDAYNSNCSPSEESPASEASSPTDSEGRESESDSEEEPRLNRKSFTNPNYPGFQHLAHELNDSFNNNYEGNNNNNGEEDKGEPMNDNKAIDYSLNILDKSEKPKEIYSRPKLDFLEVKQMNSEVEMRRSSGCREEDTLAAKDTGVKYETAGSEEAEKGEGDTKKSEKKSGGSSRTQHDKEIFDVYNIETAMPTIDLEAIESHLRAAREEERRRRNDREEIRRRLATGSDADEYYGGSDKPGKKPSLQARLQSGMNLQICFMNETSSDTESPSSESAPPNSTKNNLSSPPSSNGITTPLTGRKSVAEPPKTLNLKSRNSNSETQDFFARQARLQAEARLALTQAKDRARLQMEADRISGKVSPITEMLRASLKKVGVHFPPERRRVSRQMLTDMNVAQLQVIVNDLHTQIETLNEGLVKFLMERDELHMKQDSMLVDIEDISRYLRQRVPDESGYDSP